jgi:hypothetical protein
VERKLDGPTNTPGAEGRCAFPDCSDGRTSHVPHSVDAHCGAGSGEFCETFWCHPFTPPVAAEAQGGACLNCGHDTPHDYEDDAYCEQAYECGCSLTQMQAARAAVERFVAELETRGGKWAGSPNRLNFALEELKRERNIK